jgi:Ca2+-binding RTX toxin-like protein
MANFKISEPEDGPSTGLAIDGLKFSFSLVLGTPGNDTLLGQKGGDIILGFGGDDLIRGKGGSNVIVGGTDNDTLYGGGGGDLFVFKPGDGFDTIANFQPGDRILLLGIPENETGFIPIPNGLNGPFLGIAVVYSTADNGQGVVELPGLKNADFQWVQDAVIYG